MKHTHILDMIASLLVFLFVYTASDKLMDFGQFRVQMYHQAIPHRIARVLIYTLPGIEIITSILLMIPKTRYWAFI
jgi:hypothetical protein